MAYRLLGRIYRGPGFTLFLAKNPAAKVSATGVIFVLIQLITISGVGITNTWFAGGETSWIAVYFT